MKYTQNLCKTHYFHKFYNYNTSSVTKCYKIMIKFLSSCHPLPFRSHSRPIPLLFRSYSAPIIITIYYTYIVNINMIIST